MSDYKPGSMDIEDQEKTFAGFVNFTKWGIIGSIVFLIFLALVNG